MKPTNILATMAMMVALGAATAAANGTEPDTVRPAIQPIAAPGVAMTPVWVQMPVAGSYPYYLAVPQPVPAYPLPQMTLPPGWGPFVMVWVPLQALQPASPPGMVDYGPVADTPVVELPEVIAEPVAEPMLVAEPMSAAPKDMVVPSAPADVPASEPPANPVPSQEPVTAAPPALPESVPSAVPVAAAQTFTSPVSVPEPDVDYGPIAPTPVVDLLALTAPPAPAAGHTSAPQTVKKPAVKKKPKPKSATTVPARKRLCWSNGVVAPCR